MPNVDENQSPVAKALSKGSGPDECPAVVMSGVCTLDVELGVGSIGAGGGAMVCASPVEI